MDRKTSKSLVMGMDYGVTESRIIGHRHMHVDPKLTGKPYLCMRCGKPANGPYRGGKRNHQCKRRHMIEGRKAAQTRLDRHNAREILAREFDPDRQGRMEYDPEPYTAEMMESFKKLYARLADDLFSNGARTGHFTNNTIPDKEDKT